MICRFAESGFPYPCDITPLFLTVCSHGWSRVESVTVLPRLIVAVKKGCRAKFTEAVLLLAREADVHTYISAHRIYVHTRTYIGLVESRLISRRIHMK